MTDTFREPIQVIADILASEMAIDTGYLLLNAEEWNIPKDDKLLIALSYLGPFKIIGSTNEMDAALQEVQTVTAQATVQIDMLSFGESARSRITEVPMALSSQFSQRLQETYQCQIARQPAPSRSSNWPLRIAHRNAARPRPPSASAIGTR